MSIHVSIQELQPTKTVDCTCACCGNVHEILEYQTLYENSFEFTPELYEGAADFIAKIVWEVLRTLDGGSCENAQSHIATLIRLVEVICDEYDCKGDDALNSFLGGVWEKCDENPDETFYVSVFGNEPKGTLT